MSTSVDSGNVYQQLQLAIGHHPHLLKNRLHIDIQAGRVRLQGNVDSFFEKQMAQEAIRNIVGIDGIDNELQVVWAEGMVSNSTAE